MKDATRKSGSVLCRFLFVALAGIVFPPLGLAQDGPPNPGSQYGDPGAPNWAGHVVDVNPRGWHKVFETPYVFSTVNSQTGASGEQWEAHRDWNSNGGEKTGAYYEWIAAPYDLLAYTEVFDTRDGAEASASIIPYASSSQAWQYDGTEIPDVEEHAEVKMEGYAETVSGLCRTHLIGAVAYSSNTLSQGTIVAELSAAVEATAREAGSGSLSLSIGATWKGITIGLSGGYEVNWQETSGHRRKNTGLGTMGDGYAEIGDWFLATNHKIDNWSWADGGSPGIPNSRARADGFSYIQGTVTLADKPRGG